MTADGRVRDTTAIRLFDLERRGAPVDESPGAGARTLAELTSVLRERGAPLPIELAAYITLEATERLLKHPATVRAENISIGLDGEVRLGDAPALLGDTADREAAAALTALFGTLAEEASGLELGADEQAQGSLTELHAMLCGFLFPLDRAMCRGALSRLLRDDRALERVATSPVLADEHDEPDTTEMSPAEPSTAVGGEHAFDHPAEPDTWQAVPSELLTGEDGSAVPRVPLGEARPETVKITLQLTAAAEPLSVPAAADGTGNWRPPTPGRTDLAGAIGRYELLGMIAQGGMAQVFLGRDNPGLDVFRQVALKRIRPGLAKDEMYRGMFEDEARLALQLNHPHICHAYEFGQWGEIPYIAMEWIHGTTLAALIARAPKHGPMPAAQVVAIVAKIADALAYAHAATRPDGTPLHVVHRDVSPQNILVSFDGVVKLLDFGVAKAASQQEGSADGMLKGKFSYMSPEQCLGKPVDGRSDVFALGICLYEGLVSRGLYQRGNSFRNTHAILNEPVPSLPSEVHVPEALRTLLSRMLAKRPERRPDARSVRDALEEILGSLEEAAGPGALSLTVKRALKTQGDALPRLAPLPRDLLQHAQFVAHRESQVDITPPTIQGPALPTHRTAHGGTVHGGAVAPEHGVRAPIAQDDLERPELTRTFAWGALGFIVMAFAGLLAYALWGR